MHIFPLWFLFALASPDACHPDAIFASVRAATGGDHWKAVGGIVGDGDASAAGLAGPAHISFDVHTGRSLQRADLPLVHQTYVYDGQTTWVVNGENGVHPLDAPDAAAGSRTDAYLVRNGFFAPATDPAQFACQPEQTNGARHYDVVRVTPQAARPVDIWIDRETHRIARTVQRTPTAGTIATYDDYRPTSGVVLPFVRTIADDDGSNAVTLRFTRYSVLPAARAADFARPPEPDNFHMIGGATSTTIPIGVDNGIVSVQASVDGKGPFPFVLDTGGHAILTLDSVAALGLKPVGKAESGGGGEGKTAVQFTQTQSIRIGDAELTQIPMTVLAIPGTALGPPPPGSPPFAGILGLEVFERFAVRLDYVHKTLTLTPLRMFRYTGSGAALPIVFQEDEPLVRAQADGYDGLFGIDTGNSGATVLFGAFLTKHDFFARYPDGLATTAGGTGGLVHGSTQALGRLGIAGYTLHNFVANFVVQQRGSFSSTTEAGNIGTVILSQFTPTFDYRDRVIYFEREKDAPTKPQNRAGFGYSQSGTGVTVNVVVAKSSAAKAGIVSGDRVTAVNGTPIAAISPDALRAYTQGAAGSSLTLRIVHADETRDVVLTLHDVLCPDVPDGCPPWVEPTP